MEQAPTTQSSRKAIPAVTFDDSDSRLVEIIKHQLRAAQSALAGAGASSPQQLSELRHYVARCRQTLMNLTYVKVISEMAARPAGGV